MRLGIIYKEFVKQIEGTAEIGSSAIFIDQIVYDTRKIVSAENSAFFALVGEFRNGHDFIGNAYKKGIRVFVVSKKINPTSFPKAHFIEVENTLTALQKLAAFHRSKFTFPIVAITGSAGKTTVKEWLYHLLSPSLRNLV